MELETKCDEVSGLKASWKPFFRQLFVCSGVTTYFFIYGLFFGAPTVFVPQIRKEMNSTETMSMEMVSWLSSISSYGSLPWAVILPIIAYRFGRRTPYFILWVNTILAASLFYFSTSVTELFISGFLQGMLPTVQIAVSIMVLSEYTSPKYRGVFFTLKAATFYWAVWLSNALGTFFHWKNIGLLTIVCCFYNISIVFWPESPYWLATKGRFEECIKSHRWLKGEDEDSEKELKQLIFTQKDKIKLKSESKNMKQNTYIIKIFNALKTRNFYKPLIFSVLAICLQHFSGKVPCTIYSIDIIKKITESESTAYEGMLVLDGVTVFGMYVGVGLSKILKRRTLLLVSSSIGVMFLYILSVYLYLVHLEIISENKYLSLFLLTVFSVTISCGPVILSMCVTGELTPLKYRSLFLCVLTLLTNTLIGTVIKIAPFIFKYFNSHGAFLCYGLSSSVFVWILYKILPETKDKTLQEIEESIVGKPHVSKEEIELLNVEKLEKNCLGSSS